MSAKFDNLLHELKSRIKYDREHNRWYIIYKFEVVPRLRKTEIQRTPLLQELIIVAETKSVKTEAIFRPIVIINKDLLAEVGKFDKSKLKSIGKNVSQSWWDYFVSYVY